MYADKGRRYDEIRSLYVGQLAYTWATDSTEATRTSIEKKIDRFIEGDLEHAVEALFALLEIPAKSRYISAPSNTSPAPAVSPSRISVFLSYAELLVLHNQITQVKSPAHWDPVKTALIISIRNGVFFDRKYWARHSKGGDLLKPVYFSSTIMSDKAQQLKSRTSKPVY